MKDFIIVGAGTAGSVLAARLAENKKSQVLVIEAGGDPPLESNIPSELILLERSRVDWNFTQEDYNVDQTCSKIQKPAIQGKMLGGTSSLNYLLYDQGSYEDYNIWADIVKDSSWNYKNIKRYLKKSENVADSIISPSDRSYFGVGGPITITKENHCDVEDYLSAFEELGYEVAPEKSAAKPNVYAPQFYIIANYTRQSTANAYLSRAKYWNNLQVLKNAAVIKIIFDKDNNAVAVKVKTKNGIIKVKARKEIIICAGAISSPKLLMLSGIGLKKKLKALNIDVVSDLPVGKNLQDHSATLLVHNMKKLTKSPVSLNPGVYPAYVFTGQVDKQRHCPSYRTLNYVNLPSYLVKYCAFTYGYCCKTCNNLFANREENQFLWTFIWNLRPKARGEILLKSKNYNDPPLVQYLPNDKDSSDLIESIIESYLKVNETKFFRRAGAVFVDPKLKPCKGLAFGSQEYWKCYAKCMSSPQSDYSGTCALGSVTDSRLRVIGVNRLRVADSSVIPAVTSGGTFAATVAIAEKAADMIKEDNHYNVEDERNLMNTHDESEYDKHCKNN